jgi:hypothetical protein
MAMPIKHKSQIKRFLDHKRQVTWWLTRRKRKVVHVVWFNRWSIQIVCWLLQRQQLQLLLLTSFKYFFLLRSITTQQDKHFYRSPKE